MFSIVGVAAVLVLPTSNRVVAHGNVGANAVVVVDDETATKAAVKRVANRTIVVW